MFPLQPLLAQEVQSVATDQASGFNWLYVFNPAVVWVLIPVTAILVGMIGTIVHRSQQHRERMAMIAAGMHPDYPPDDDPPMDGGPGRETTAHR